MNISFRTTAGVIALTIASLAVPSLAHAKRFGKSVAPARIGKAPAAPATPLLRPQHQPHPQHQSPPPLRLRQHPPQPPPPVVRE